MISFNSERTPIPQADTSPKSPLTLDRNTLNYTAPDLAIVNGKTSVLTVGKDAWENATNILSVDITDYPLANNIALQFEEALTKEQIDEVVGSLEGTLKEITKEDSPAGERVSAGEKELLLKTLTDKEIPPFLLTFNKDETDYETWYSEDNKLSIYSGTSFEEPTPLVSEEEQKEE